MTRTRKHVYPNSFLNIQGVLLPTGLDTKRTSRSNDECLLERRLRKAGSRVASGRGRHLAVRQQGGTLQRDAVHSGLVPGVRQRARDGAVQRRGPFATALFALRF